MRCRLTAIHTWENKAEEAVDYPKSWSWEGGHLEFEPRQPDHRTCPAHCHVASLEPCGTSIDWKFVQLTSLSLVLISFSEFRLVEISDFLGSSGLWMWSLISPQEQCRWGRQGSSGLTLFHICLLWMQSSLQLTGQVAMPQWSPGDSSPSCGFWFQFTQTRQTLKGSLCSISQSSISNSKGDLIRTLYSGHW